MIKMTKKTRGAVSVFLVIILVPCLLVASIFVDISRVQLSKSVAESSADLALNTLMTNYDYDLNDWYGMVASCQNIDEFYSVSMDYFSQAMKSQGLSDEEIANTTYVTREMMNNVIIGNTVDVSNLLQTTETEATTVTAVDNADLTNATLIKEQVVEFMKYRGPYTITTELVDRLKQDESYTGFIEANKNEPIVEDKEEYYTAESDLLEAAYNTYWYLYDNYSNYNNGEGVTNEEISKMLDDVKADYKDYYDIHALMVTNFINTGDLGKYTRAHQDYYSITLPAISSVRSGTYTNENDAKISIITSTSVNQYVQSLQNAEVAFDIAKDAWTQAAAGVPYGSNVNLIQYWVQLDKATSGSVQTDLNKAVQDLNTAYGNLASALCCEPAPEDPNAAAAMKAGSAECEKVKTNYYDKYLTTGVVDDSDAYLLYVNRLESYGILYESEINPSVKTIEAGTYQGYTIDQALSTITTKLQHDQEKLDALADALDVVINGKGLWGSDKIVSLDKLVSLAADCEEKLSDWEGSCENAGTEMGTKDLQEINGVNGDADSVAAHATEANVSELKTRLSNIKSQLEEISAQIDSVTYDGTQIKLIGTYESLRSHANSGVVGDNIPSDKDALNRYIQTTFDQLYKEAKDYTYNTDTSYNATLNPKTGEVSVPDFYMFLDEKFGGANRDEVTKQKSKLKDLKQTGEDQKNKDTDIKAKTPDVTFDTFSNHINTQYNFGLSDIGTIASMVENIAGGDIENIRDNLYLALYAKEMFTYDTFEYEGKLYGEDSDGNPIMSDEAKRDLTTENYVSKYGAESIKSVWVESNDAKSLTMNLMEAASHPAYEEEIEYILYGNNTAEGGNTAADRNVKAAYADIAEIRETLNLVSGFQHFWSIQRDDKTSMTINSIASAVFTATQGIVPQALTKCILIGVLSGFETHMDIMRLKAGFRVCLYKSNSDDWVYAIPSVSYSGNENALDGFTSALQAVSNGVAWDKDYDESGKPSGITYSDYLTLFLALGFQNDSGENSKSEAMTIRMAEVVQKNMKAVSENADYSMAKSKVYFTLTAGKKVSPLLITAPIFSSYLGDFDTSGTWCDYDVKVTRGY